MRYRLCCVSQEDSGALRERYAALAPQWRLYPPGKATPVRMAAELTLRTLLAEHTGAAPDSFRFQRTAHGKPYAEHAPYFNLSHSCDWFLCAVSDTPVGVDIETPRKVSPALVRRICTPAELAFLAGAPECFLQIWTAKEAYLKYLGTGICCDLRKIDTVRGGQIAVQNLHCLREQTEAYTFTILYE